MPHDGAVPPDRDTRLLDRFELLLVVVLAALVVQSLIDVRDSEVGRSITHAVSGIALLVAVRAAGVRRRWRRAADVLVIVVLVANVLYLILSPETLAPTTEPGPEVAWLVATALVPLVVIRRIAQQVDVGIQTVMGAVAAYLQIAIAYAFAFQSLDAITGEPFFGKVVPTTTYTYVSLETITTLGYGDFVPAADLGRLLAVSEAVVGQVYLVTFVALIVSRFARRPAGRASRPKEDEEASR